MKIETEEIFVSKAKVGGTKNWESMFVKKSRPVQGSVKCRVLDSGFTFFVFF